MVVRFRFCFFWSDCRNLRNDQSAIYGRNRREEVELRSGWRRVIDSGGSVDQASLISYANLAPQRQSWQLATLNFNGSTML